MSGEFWVTGLNLYRYTNGGSAKTQVANVSAAIAVGFGKAAPGQTHPAVYLVGTGGGTYGFFRCDDGLGAGWTRINDNNHQFGNAVGVEGDENIYGRAYVGAGGRGILYGDMPAVTPTASMTPMASLTVTTTATQTPTNTYTITDTPAVTATPTATPTLTPAQVMSGLGKSVLAPVPVKAGGSVCLYPDAPIASSHLDVFDLMGESLKSLNFAGGQPCWNTAGMGAGIYAVRMKLVYADGRSGTFWQKIIVAHF
jgi:hypothetical protein